MPISSLFCLLPRAWFLIYSLTTSCSSLKPSTFCLNSANEWYTSVLRPLREKISSSCARLRPQLTQHQQQQQRQQQHHCSHCYVRNNNVDDNFRMIMTMMMLLMTATMMMMTTADNSNYNDAITDSGKLICVTHKVTHIYSFLFLTDGE